MEQLSKIHVGLDTHKESISIGRADPGRDPGRLVTKIGHDVNKLIKALGKIGAPDRLHIVYEAGPTGYGLQRKLTQLGYLCEIIAPSQTPQKPGSRIKNDTRDCIGLAESSRAGQLTKIWIPDPADEAIRDLSRAREDAVGTAKRARQHLSSFLLRHDVRYSGKTAWTKSHYAWLAALKVEALAGQVALTEYLLEVTAAAERVKRLTKALEDCARNWRMAPVVEALQAMRGIALVTAVGLIAELGDLSRFDHPRKLMAYLGLVPSEESSGDKVRRGGITKSGNAHARRLLIEAAWNYRFNAKIGPDALQRQQGLSEAVRATAWKAQLRLTKRFAALSSRGVQKNKVATAVARELSGFVWAVGMQAMREHSLTA